MAMSKSFAQNAEAYVKGFMDSYKVLVQYLRDETSSEKYGVVVAFRLRPTWEVKMGHSVCRLEAGDTFNKYIGLYIAIQRALKGGHLSVNNAESLSKVYKMMDIRSSKYFRVPTPVGDELYPSVGPTGNFTSPDI